MNYISTLRMKIEKGQSHHTEVDSRKSLSSFVLLGTPIKVQQRAKGFNHEGRTWEEGNQYRIGIVGG